MNRISISSFLATCFLGLVLIGMTSAYRQCGTQYCVGDDWDSYCCGGSFLNSCCYYYNYDDYMWVLWVTIGVVFFVTLLVSICVAVCIRNRRLRQAALYQQAYASGGQFMNRTSYMPPSQITNPQPIYTYTNLPPPSNLNPTMAMPPPAYDFSNPNNNNQKY